ASKGTAAPDPCWRSGLVLGENESMPSRQRRESRDDQPPRPQGATPMFRTNARRLRWLATLLAALLTLAATTAQAQVLDDSPAVLALSSRLKDFFDNVADGKAKEAYTELLAGSL